MEPMDIHRGLVAMAIVAAGIVATGSVATGIVTAGIAATGIAATGLDGRWVGGSPGGTGGWEVGGTWKAGVEVGRTVGFAVGGWHFRSGGVGPRLLETSRRYEQVGPTGSSERVARGCGKPACPAGGTYPLRWGNPQEPVTQPPYTYCHFLCHRRGLDGTAAGMGFSVRGPRSFLNP